MRALAWFVVLISLPGLAAPAAPPPPETASRVAPAIVAPGDPVTPLAPVPPLAPVAPSTPPAPLDPGVATLQAAESNVRALAAGTLAADVDPAGLFDVSLDDEAAVAVEAERLRAVVAHADELARPVVVVEPPPSDDVVEPRDVVEPGEVVETVAPVEPPEVVESHEVAAVVGPVEARAPAVSPFYVPPDTLDAALWAARVALDRARLAFLELPVEQRSRLLADHAERSRRDAETKRAVALSETEERARQAREAERVAQEAVQRAHSEAERLVSEEHVRLLGVASAQADFDTALARARQEGEQRIERTLKLRRSVRDLVASPPAPGSGDALYTELRAWLRSSRGELGAALSLAAEPAPVPGDDALKDSGVDIDRAVIDKLRRQLSQRALELDAQQAAERWERAQRLYEDVRGLNADRLALLPTLSPQRRDQVIGLGWGGIDQASAELLQITLVLRYHTQATVRWIRSVLEGGDARGEAVLTGGFVGFKWLLALLVFFAWRRRAGSLLEGWRVRLQQRADRLPVRHGSRRAEAIRVIEHVRGPLEGLLLVAALVWLLPEGGQDLLEVQIVVQVAVWTLGGLLVVQTIDALAALEHTSSVFRAAARLDTAVIRRRSLDLVGRTVVVFALILALSRLLVGQGTIYSWVWSVCWFAAIPLFLVLVRWWRPMIFERIDLIRKKGAFERWVVAHREGWKSFAAAMAAGIFLFVSGAARLARGWLNGIEIARRVHAYLYRRDLDRRVARGEKAELGRLPPTVFATLSPDTPSTELVEGLTDREVAGVVERINRLGGGLFAVVGERGAGKTTVLRRVAASRDDVVLVDGAGGVEGVREQLVRMTGLPADATLEDAARRLDLPDAEGGVLIDDGQRLVSPIIGGLAAFDSLVRVARTNSRGCTWFFAFDASLWRFIESARGARPTFDDVVFLRPWSEEDITRLLAARCRQAELTPRFDRLVEQLPPDADEVDRQEAAAREAAGTYRLLWDHSGGNPGVALHTWRRSLGTGPDGDTYVSIFDAPDPRDLERLPDEAVFVLRAVVQLQPVTPGEVARATSLRPDQVDDMLRYGLARDYFRRDGDRYVVTWAWYRTITRLLQRRHLLAQSR